MYLDIAKTDGQPHMRKDLTKDMNEQWKNRSHSLLEIQTFLSYNCSCLLLYLPCQEALT